jgi:membrane protease YdiL (CAAX protease family)
MDSNPAIGPTDRQKKCSYCGRENSEDAESCLECGTRLAQNLPPPSIAQEKPASISANPQKVSVNFRNKCSYCGRENVDEVQYCAECGSRLPPRPTPVVDAQPPETLQGPLPSSEIINLDNPWVAKDAWKCLGMFVVLHVGIGQMLRAVEILVPAFQHLAGTGAGHVIYSIIHYSVFILTALYFARVESLETFLKAFGLMKIPSTYTWFAVAMTLTIRLAGHWLITSGSAKGATTTSLWGFAHTTGFERILFLAPALIAPFGEELYMRGFFYRAFRGSYSVLASTLLILGITIWTHLDQYYRSWVAAVELSALTVLQCFLRERTGNLRDCIICHLVYNATGALLMLRVH